MEQRQMVLKARAMKLAEVKKEDIDHEKIEVISFKLSTESYAIESLYVHEVVPIKEFTPLPCVPSFILGLMQVRRQIFPIIDLRPLFDLPIQHGEMQKAIILQKDEREFALLIDDLYGMHSIAVNAIQAPLPTLTGIRQEFLKGITEQGIIILDGQKLLQSSHLIINEG